jgi:hypothetical protein
MATYSIASAGRDLKQAPRPTQTGAGTPSRPEELANRFITNL